MKKSSILVNALASGLGVFTIPMLAFFYGESDIGIYAVYLSVSMIVAAVAGLRTEYLVLTVPSKNKIIVAAFFQICIYSLLAIALVMIASFLFDELLYVAVAWSLAIAYAVPLFSSNYFLAASKYRKLDQTRVGRVVLAFIFQLIFYFLWGNYWGLIVGSLLSSSMLLLVLVCDRKKLFYVACRNVRSASNLAKYFVIFRSAVTYQLPHALFNSFVNNIIVSFISIQHGSSRAAHYFLAEKFYRTPISLVIDILRPYLIKEKLSGNARSFKDSYFYLFAIFWVVVSFVVMVIAGYYLPGNFTMIEEIIHIGPYVSLLAAASLCSLPFIISWTAGNNSKMLFYTDLCRLAFLGIYYIFRPADMDISSDLIAFSIVLLFPPVALASFIKVRAP